MQLLFLTTYFGTTKKKLNFQSKRTFRTVRSEIGTACRWEDMLGMYERSCVSNGWHAIREQLYVLLYRMSNIFGVAHLKIILQTWNFYLIRYTTKSICKGTLPAELLNIMLWKLYKNMSKNLPNGLFGTILIRQTFGAMTWGIQNYEGMGDEEYTCKELQCRPKVCHRVCW